MTKVKRSLITAIAMLIILLAGILMFACGDDKGKNELTSHTITCLDGEWYDIKTSSVLAQTGDTIIVEVTCEVFVQVESVYANDIPCTPSQQEGFYTFVMPESDVQISAQIIEGEEILTSDYGISWTLAPDQIAKAKEGDSSFIASQSFEIDFGSQYVNASMNGQGNMIYTEVFSLNQDVIPNEAISAVKPTSTLSNGKYSSAKFSIDLTKINLGTTTIVFHDTDNGRVISKKITVKEYGLVQPDKLWTVTIVVDMHNLESYQNDKFRIFFSDEGDYVYGSTYLETQFYDFDFTTIKDGKRSFVFQFNPAHQFTVNVGYQYQAGDLGIRYNYFNILSGATEEGEIVVTKDKEILTIIFDDYDMAEELG